MRIFSYNMKKVILTAIFAVAGLVNAHAQLGGTVSEVITSEQYAASVRRNTVFAEVVVNDNAQYTVNYDHILIALPKFKLSATLGAGISPSYPQNNEEIGRLKPVLNLGMNALSGQGKHHFEGGLGLSTVFADEQTPASSEPFYTPKGVKVSQYQAAQSYHTLSLNARLGYRFQSNAGGLFFRAGLLPSLRVYSPINPTNRASIGATLGLGFTF